MLTAVLLFHIDGLFRLAFSVIILHLFDAVAADNKTIAYIYVAILTVIYYISQLFKELGLNIGYLLASRIKSSFSMLLYAKLSKLTSYVLNSS